MLFNHTGRVAILVSSIHVGCALAGSPIPPTPIPEELPLLADSNPPSDGLLALTDVPTAPVAPAPRPSTNVTINLINRMVKKGLLEQAEADELIKQAEADVLVARQETAAVALKAVEEIQAATAPPPTDDAVRVTYIPETVKAQIREQIKSEIMNKARDENWASPRTFPSWATRMRFNGDVRIRGEGIYFPSSRFDSEGNLVAGNDNTGSFPNFNAINTGAPFDVAGTTFSPQFDVDKDRTRLRLRARFGIEADLGDGFSAGIRLATGNDNQPVTANQTFGAAGNGQGGNFSKYALWLDRGFLKYELGGLPTKDLTLLAGRFDNPFFKASEIMWDDDIGFDGLAAKARYQVLPGFVPFLTGGAFPIFNTDLNFATNNPAKFRSYDKWLYAVQVGFDWKITPPINFKFGASYNYFSNVEGRLSSPFVPLSPSDAGDTDATRPSYAQYGNTYRPLRNIIPTVDNDYGTSKQYQYFGLATPFRVLNLSGQLDLNFFEPMQISVMGEYAKNLAFEQSAIDAIAVNNRGPHSRFQTGRFEGGDTAWYAGVRFGRPVFEKRWDWNVGVSYRHVESDAVMDAFVDSDFGMIGGYGGTNLEGYTISGNLALSPKVSIGARWMSANGIAGPDFKSDVFELDLNGKF